MSKLNILQAITNGIWLIQPEFVHASSGLVQRILNGQDAIKSYHDDSDDDEVKFKSSFCISPLGAISYGNKYNPFEGATPNSTAVIGMSGPIMKYDNCGDPGTKTYSSILEKAKSNPNINSVVLVMDSPGGTVDGTMDLATLVKNFNKPIVAFVDGLMASAAYWIGSGANEIIANNETSTIGSIGTMISFADVQKMWEEKGVKFHYITADASIDKNKDFLDARQGNYKLLKEKLNAINDLFLAGVTENRGSKLDLKKENVLTGKTYLAQDSLANGLIDSINTFEYAVERAQALASGDTAAPVSDVKLITEKPQTNNMKKITLMASSIALIALCGATIESGAESVDVELNDDLISKINASLVAGAKAQSDLSALKTKATTDAKALADLQATLDIAEAKVKSLENPGASAAVKNGTDDLSETDKTNAEVWELAHNKAVINDPLFS